MNSTNPSVGIVVLSWNDWKNTSALLDSIFKSNYIKYDVIVVDNNSDSEHFEKLLNWCEKKKIKVNRINFKPKTTLQVIIQRRYVHNFPAMILSSSTL